jgi:hypothetical protein
MPHTFTVSGTAITFRVLLDGAELGRVSALSVRHVPGGNVTYLDDGGLEAPTLQCRVKLSAFTDLVALQALQGQSGTLSYGEASYTAVLRSCRRTRVMGVNDQHFAACDFVLSA